MDLENMDISPELREKAKACKTPDELLALAKSEGYKLSDEEMEAVAGGGSWGGAGDSDCSDDNSIGLVRLSEMMRTVPMSPKKP
ncbi:MAG: Nif11-like leader peptide family natural product precursor [Eggerthellaceae bacterium]|nr:Nif11-like leader peptide family natural product precursor [Eggerthellaceae bacterium]MBQ9069710.1 Nif11-like leader peptide family natural product precursor [Eggerthellaceae bacterium]